MKKLTLALALVLLLSCFLLAACSGDGDNTSDTSSKTESSKTESSKTESSKTESSKAESSKAASSEAASSATSAATSSAGSNSEETSGTTSAVGGASEELKREGTNLALNCTVAGAELPARDDIQKYSAKLTDGKVAENVAYDDSWFGYWWNSEAQYAEQSNTQNGVGIATIDLGAAKDIKEVCVYLAFGNDSGIATPTSVKFEYSEDGTNYILIGEKTYEKVTGKVALTADWVGFSMPETVKAKYVRVSIQNGNIWAFLNEIEVY